MDICRFWKLLRCVTDFQFCYILYRRGYTYTFTQNILKITLVSHGSSQRDVLLPFPYCSWSCVDILNAQDVSPLPITFVFGIHRVHILCCRYLLWIPCSKSWGFWYIHILMNCLVDTYGALLCYMLILSVFFFRRCQFQNADYFIV